MTDTFIVGFDGSESARRAADFALERAKLAKAKLHLVQVLEWSPYSFHTPEELAERHKRREQELDRANAIVQPVADELNAAGVETTCEARHGNAGELLSEIAEAKGAVQIIIGRSGGTGLANRLLGSLVITLAQAAPVPVTIVP
jgi:nucleotide-binding universal stress UspA family protein